MGMRSMTNHIMRFSVDAALEATGAIRGTSQTKFYVQLEFLSLSSQDDRSKDCVIFMNLTHLFPMHPFSAHFQLIPQETHSYNTRNSEDIPTYNCRTDSLKNSFFPWTSREWGKLGLDIRKPNYNVFRQHLLKVI